MKISMITIKNYRSLRDVSVEFGNLCLFIGANGSGKSAILDALRFLSEAVRARSFRAPTYARGGFLNMAWKGQEADRIELDVALEHSGKRFEWSVRLMRQSYEFYVEESVHETPWGSAPVHLLNADKGEGWWWSDAETGYGRVGLSQNGTRCALAAAYADASFPAREVVEFVESWSFFDSESFLASEGLELARLGGVRRLRAQFGETLHALSKEKLEAVVSATRSIVGLPDSIRLLESDDRLYFQQYEPGLQFPVNQTGVSSGTLRVLALMTALYGQSGTALIGIEEPENYIHPSALEAFAVHILDARERVQFMVTTHSQ